MWYLKTISQFSTIYSPEWGGEWDFTRGGWYGELRWVRTAVADGKRSQGARGGGGSPGWCDVPGYTPCGRNQEPSEGEILQCVNTDIAFSCSVLLQIVHYWPDSCIWTPAGPISNAPILIFSFFWFLFCCFIKHTYMSFECYNLKTIALASNWTQSVKTCYTLPQSIFRNMRV